MPLLSRDWAMPEIVSSVQPNPTLVKFILCLFFVALLSACGELSKEQSKKIDEALKDSLTKTTESWGVDMNITEDGIKKVRMLGQYAATYNTKETNETRIKGPVTIHVFTEDGKIKTRVHSNRAIYKADDAIFEFFGDVKVNTSDNRHLESEYLKWRQNKDLINTPKFMIITTPSDSIAGTGFEGTAGLTNYTIKNPKGRVTVN